VSAPLPTSEASFREVEGELVRGLGPGEHLTLDLRAEDSLFVRVTQAKVRQAGRAQVGELGLLLVVEGEGSTLREASAAIGVTGEPAKDLAEARAALARLRAEVRALPPSPWARVPEAGPSSHAVARGALVAPDRAADALLAPAAGLDLAGILASGTVVRATATSRGTRHWFEADTFSFDHSAYAPSGAAHKATYAGTRWDQASWEAAAARARETVALLGREPREVPRGEHRVWLGPAAIAEIVAMLSWGCMGEAAVRQGDSPLRHVRAGTHRFSPRFSLREDFSYGDVPRFTSEGDVAPEVLPLVDKGELVSTLVSARSAREYGVTANGAETSEGLRAPAIAPGSLDEADVLRAIGTGLYVPNLWYLNWSDQPGGRITGMTRYACLWVEDGRAVAPIQHLRFDDSIFRMLGPELEELGREVHVVPDTLSYDFRAVGGLRSPGMLLRRMAFTL
jgi:predicted Zn-dependent protease